MKKFSICLLVILLSMPSCVTEHSTTIEIEEFTYWNEPCLRYRVKNMDMQTSVIFISDSIIVVEKGSKFLIVVEELQPYDPYNGNGKVNIAVISKDEKVLGESQFIIDRRMTVNIKYSHTSVKFFSD